MNEKDINQTNTYKRKLNKLPLKANHGHRARKSCDKHHAVIMSRLMTHYGTQFDGVHHVKIVSSRSKDMTHSQA